MSSEILDGPSGGMAPFMAVRVGETTLVGVGSGPFPLARGNCFVVVDGGGGRHAVVNFCRENLEAALARGTSDDPAAPGVTWPVRCLSLLKPTSTHGGVALLHDPRIPVSWYRSTWCEVCCPEDLLPIPQRLIHALRREAGEERLQEAEGMLLRSSDPSRRVRLPGA